MKKRNKLLTLFFLLAGAIAGGYALVPLKPRASSRPAEEFRASGAGLRKIKIANWNLEVFGDSKASKPELMQSYADVIRQYDIIFIQEIRDKDSSAFYDLCRLLPGYEFKISSRAGRSSTKEQYGLLYRKGLQLKDFKDFNPDPQNRWERPPICVSFNVDTYDFTVYNIHTDPDDVKRELSHLERLASQNPESNITVLGDLNADQNYYSNPKETEFDSWRWLIKDSEDTTATSTNAAYDRIIMSPDAFEEYSGHGINKSTSRAMSNHYPVWVEISAEEK
jgi:endonuclease/exonuclease/phosphatase family metal-dependent hydrolase